MYGKALSNIPALKPYWEKPAVRNFREGNGNVGIMRSPLRAIALPDLSMPVVVSGAGADGQAFQQEKHTVVVNARGALVLLRTKVTLGQVLTIRNVKTNAPKRGSKKDPGSRRARCGSRRHSPRALHAFD